MGNLDLKIFGKMGFGMDGLQMVYRGGQKNVNHVVFFKNYVILHITTLVISFFYSPCIYINGLEKYTYNGLEIYI